MKITLTLIEVNLRMRCKNMYELEIGRDGMRSRGKKVLQIIPTFLFDSDK